MLGRDVRVGARVLVCVALGKRVVFAVKVVITRVVGVDVGVRVGVRVDVGVGKGVLEAVCVGAVDVGNGPRSALAV